MAEAAEPTLRPAWVFGLATLGSFALTFPRVAREVVLFGDSAELVAAAKVWGVPHPTGYPLWTLLAHLASRASFGGVAYRVHLTSSVFHALAVGVVAVLAQRLSGSVVAALGAALTLCLAKSFLLGSTYAEVFPLNDLFFALLLFVAIAVREAPATSQPRGLLLLAALGGLSLGHHQMTALGVPALAILVWPALRRALVERPARALGLGVAACTPVALSLGLLWLASRRHAIVDYGDVHDLASLFRVVTRSDYGGLLSASRHPSRLPVGDRIGAMTLSLAESLGPLALVAALAGTVVLVYGRRSLALALFVAWFVPGPVFAALNRVHVAGEAQVAFFERFTTMAHVPLAILAGLGCAWLATRLPHTIPGRRAVGFVVGALPGLALLPQARHVDPSHDRAGLAVVEDLYRDVPDGSLVLISGDLYTSATQYLCATDPICERLIIAAPGQLFLPWKLTALRRSHPELALPEGPLNLGRTHEIIANEIARRPVYIAPNLIFRDPALTNEFEFFPMRLLHRVFPLDRGGEGDRARFLELAHVLAAGDGVEGARLDPRTIQRPSQHVEVIEAYAAMYSNTARTAAGAGASDDALRLESRARVFEQLARH